MDSFSVGILVERISLGELPSEGFFSEEMDFVGSLTWFAFVSASKSLTGFETLPPAEVICCSFFSKFSEMGLSDLK